ncbi:blue copper protein-like [Vitis riparia]|uniref:blue copper protein-like n=1 Tax=Vitis riparia TaxID=96939 RepID=UPI00155A7599|nr:blue copper protein-like [Vitis riparia]
MASKRFVGTMAILAFVLPVVAMLLKVLWSILIHAVFKCTAGRHNVFKVNGTAFMNCTIPLANEALSTGNDVITLAAPRRKWYICGVNDHCANYGQKLAITVLEASTSPAPAPSTPTAPAPSSAHGISGSGYHLLMAAMVAVAFLVVWPVFTPEEP